MGINYKNRVTGPEPDTIEFYDYEITCIRTEFLDVYDLDPTTIQISIKGGAFWSLPLTKINKLKFKGIIRQLPTHMRGEWEPNRIYVVNPRRWRKMIKMPNNQVWGIPHSVGDRFILRNLKTGYTKELQRIVPHPTYTKYEGTMAEFYTLKGGVIVNER